MYVLTDDPRREYVQFVSTFAQKKEEEDQKRTYTLMAGGYYLGENTQIGEGSHIDLGCLIGHDVRIGRNARVYSGARIKNAFIGDNFIAGENCTVGVYGFTLAKDRAGNNIRIPVLGKVVIGDNVEIGALSSVAAGCAGDTVLHNYVKLDAQVYIAHDAQIFENVKLPAGTVIGGYSCVKENAATGFNATVRNRIEIGKMHWLAWGLLQQKVFQNIWLLWEIQRSL